MYSKKSEHTEQFLAQGVADYGIDGYVPPANSWYQTASKQAMDSVYIIPATRFTWLMETEGENWPKFPIRSLYELESRWLEYAWGYNRDLHAHRRLIISKKTLKVT